MSTSTSVKPDSVAPSPKSESTAGKSEASKEEKSPGGKMSVNEIAAAKTAKAEPTVQPPTLTADEISRVEDFIKRFYKTRDGLPEAGSVLTLEEVEWLIGKAQKVFAYQPMLVEMETPIAICGDTHGQFSDLLRLFEKGGKPPKTRYLFLGDYVDRGPSGVEVICVMFAYKVRYWNDFFVLRGNHETSSINRVYGFYDECKRKFGDSADVYKKFNACFDFMPLAALVNRSVFCMHGGISPELTDFEQISKLPRPLSKINPTGIPCDLLWADPDPSVHGFQRSTRGISYLFGSDAVQKFCQDMNIDMIVRAHQVVHDGYEFFAGHQLLTVFSAPDYCNQFDNAAGFVMIQPSMEVAIKQLKSKKARKGGGKSVAAAP